MNINLHLWLIPVLPLIGAAINGLFGRRFPQRVVNAIALAFPGAALLQALWIASQFGSLRTIPHVEILGRWIQAGSFTVNFGYQLDQLSMVMLLVVTGVGFLIHIYSVGYMAHEGGYYRFFAYLNLFMFFMLTLILANNYLLMFVGWEGVGLASYLLIGFYFLKDSAANAGKKAFIVNRIGDFGFLIAMFLIIKLVGSLDYNIVFSYISKQMVVEQHWGTLTITALLLMVGAAGKSAQIPLYVWLPDAMEGPTPVSALIHAATMVTAGVYMVARSNVIFNHAPHALVVVAIIGCATAIFAATMGITQTDIKRVLAYSTVSQLGYMFLACGVGAYAAGIFHLMTHAFFKALLFLAAGSVIHALSGEQDMRHMGGLRKLIPWTFGTMTVATIAIAGIPPLAGFFSKDEILWQTFSSKAFSSVAGSELNIVLWLLGIITAFMTSFYMFRLWFMTFFGERRESASPSHDPAHASPHGTGDDHDPSQDHAHGHGGVHESPWSMLGPLVILAVLATIGGWVGVPHVLGGSNHFESFMRPVIEHEAAAPATHNTPNPEAPNPAQAGTAEPHGDTGTELALTGVSVLTALSGFGLAYLFYYKRRELPDQIAARMHGLYQTVLNKYYVDEIYNAIVVRPLMWFSTKVLWRTVDVAIIDGTVNHVAADTRSISDRTRRMQSGNVRSYAGWVAAGAAAVLAFMIWAGIKGVWTR
jgi:NADH-quinone oxidoreductase subunit L